jgi:hypothetical protein
MANNRLYLVDTETYEWILLAKGWSSGWQYWTQAPIEEFLESHNENSDPRDLTAAGAFGEKSLNQIGAFHRGEIYQKNAALNPSGSQSRWEGRHDPRGDPRLRRR